MHEIFRVLQPGGTFLCAAFGEQTFSELKACFARACRETGYTRGEALQLHGSAEHCRATLAAAGFIPLFTTSDMLTQRYPSVADLIHSIKGMGAQNASRKRNRGLGIRRIWKRMIAVYEADFREQDGHCRDLPRYYGRGTQAGTGEAGSGALQANKISILINYLQWMPSMV